MLRLLFIVSLLNALDVFPQAPAAVLELFTSQGCSSCPPAEELMSKLARSSDSLNVVILSFHVDYWNYLGWNDPFSKPEFSDRQRLYKHYNVSDGIYTPQLIINGTSAFTGGNGARMNREIAALKGKAFPANISLKMEALTNDKVKVSYTVSGTDKECVMNFAIVTSGDFTNVKTGENAGRMLQSTNTVRTFSYKLLQGTSGSALLDLPAGISADDLTLIVMRKIHPGPKFWLFQCWA